MLIQADGLRKVKLTLCERSLIMLQKADKKMRIRWCCRFMVATALSHWGDLEVKRGVEAMIRCLVCS